MLMIFTDFMLIPMYMYIFCSLSRSDPTVDEMTTLDHRKSAPLPLGGSTGSAFDDDASSESLGSSIPEFIMLQVILPDGSIQKVEVNSG